MKKILPLATPLVETYPSYANQLSVLQLDYERTQLWILLKLMSITTYYVKDEKGLCLWIMLDDDCFLRGNLIWEECPYLKIFTYQRKHFATYEIDIVDFIKNSIDDGQYIYTFVCQNDISAYHINTKQRRAHDIFIFGYNDDEQAFYTSDYYGIHYSQEKVKYTELKIAFENCDEKTMRDEFEAVIAISPAKTGVALKKRNIYEQYNTDANQFLKIIIERLKININFIQNNTNVINVPYLFYGISTYDAVIRYLTDSNYCVNSNVITNVFFISDHKKMLLELTKITKRNEAITLQAQGLFDDSKVLNNLFLKLLISKREKTCNKVRECLLKMRKKEEVFTKMLIESLECDY